MRFLYLFFIHIKLLFHKNIRNFALFLAEIVLSVIFISSFITTVFFEFNYKINYLKPEQYDNYAVLSIHSSISNNMYLEITDDVYREMIDTIENIPSVLSVGYSSDETIKIDGLPVTHITYTPLLNAFKHPTMHGNWLSENSDTCILGGDLSELYDPGDICYIEGQPYQVIDHLSEPYYVIDSGVAGSLNITNTLTNPGNVIITTQSHDILIQSPYFHCVYASLVIKYNSETTSLDQLKQDLSEFGAVYSMTDLVDNAKSIRNSLISDNLPILLSIMLICILIATSGLLIAAENNKKSHAILLLLGEKKSQMIAFIITFQFFILSVGWSIGTLLSKQFCSFLFGVELILTEAKQITALLLSGIWFINAIIVLFAYKNNSLTTYRNNE